MWSSSVPASSCNVSVLSGICLAMAVHAERRLHRAEHCEVSLQPLCREASATSSGHSGARLSGNLGGCVCGRPLGCLRSDSPEAEPEMRVTRKGIYRACTPRRIVWGDGGSSGGKGKQASKVWTQANPSLSLVLWGALGYKLHLRSSPNWWRRIGFLDSSSSWQLAESQLGGTSTPRNFWFSFMWQSSPHSLWQPPKKFTVTGEAHRKSRWKQCTGHRETVRKRDSRGCEKSTDSVCSLGLGVRRV